MREEIQDGCRCLLNHGEPYCLMSVCWMYACYMHTGDTGDTCCCFASTYVDASAVGEPSQHFCCHVFCEDVCGGVLVSLVGTLCSDTTPPWMRSWMNMNLSSMCFARFDTPCLVAIDFPACAWCSGLP